MMDLEIFLRGSRLVEGVGPWKGEDRWVSTLVKDIHRWVVWIEVPVAADQDQRIPDRPEWWGIGKSPRIGNEALMMFEAHGRIAAGGA
ncbi:MAG: hypothetical protein LBG99_09075 [Propionibacteriaceae bacterium]|nr:hypothetical protein [Propionibacteriaceae bacterium]